MTTSIVAICNMALARMGTQTQISSLADPTNAAQQCALWYDALRQDLLREAPWGFARKQLVLSQLGYFSNGTSPYPWLYKYAHPSDCLKMRYVLPSPPELSDGAYYRPLPHRDHKYIIGHDVDADNNEIAVVLTNVEAAIGVYTCDVQNVDLFDSKFTQALVALLAHDLIIPLAGNIGMKESLMADKQKLVLSAQAADGNEAISTNDIEVDWIEGRNHSLYPYCR